MKALVLTLLFLLIALTGAKIFSRCELASFLKQNELGYSPDHLGQSRQKAKIIEICDLYYILKFYRMDPFKGIYSEQFVCAADYSSRLDTLYYENVYGIPRYGIFQISGFEWCDNGRHYSPNRCNMSCDLLLDDDIEDDALCAKKIVERTKDMRAWPLYLKYCNKKTVQFYYIKCLFGKKHPRSQN
ncbi:lysozyme C-like [Erythrolamprus reginae]|uniref:lysozyme C-like n=1 Tax=Erythrolamprus reginae TaxID=121349 RepID=UPI00396CE775